jgi:hypothetical protein
VRALSECHGGPLNMLRSRGNREEFHLRQPRRPTLKKSLRTIERAFADLERSLARLGKQARKAARDAAREAARSARRSGRKTGRWVGVLGKPRRRPKLTPTRRAQLKLQGKYMTYMRQLGPRKKSRVGAVKEKRGFEAAIATAR